MKKLFIALIFLGFITSANATTIIPNLSTATVATSIQEMDEEAPVESASFTQELKKRFIDSSQFEYK